MIHIAVCDDESGMAKELGEKVRDYFTGENVAVEIHCFQDGRKLLQYTDPLHIVFLDIMMDGPDGIETARVLRERDYQGFLIFVTVLRELVYDSFEVQAFDYLVKPIREDRFARVMERLLKCIRNNSAASLYITRGSECSLIPFEDIVFCEVIGRKVYLHLKNNKVMDYYEKIENLAGKLDERFYQCHRSYLLNLSYLRSYKDDRAYLCSGDTVPVSRLRRAAFCEAMLMYMKNRRGTGK